MSEIRDRAISKAEVIIQRIWRSAELNPDKSSLQKRAIQHQYLKQILSTPEIAIVDREAELPDRVYFNEDNKDMELELSGHTQVDMLKTGWVKEVKDADKDK